MPWGSFIFQHWLLSTGSGTVPASCLPHVWARAYHLSVLCHARLQGMFDGCAHDTCKVALLLTYSPNRG